jgi:hypothetical protein
MKRIYPIRLTLIALGIILIVALLASCSDEDPMEVWGSDAEFTEISGTWKLTGITTTINGEQTIFQTACDELNSEDSKYLDYWTLLNRAATLTKVKFYHEGNLNYADSYPYECSTNETVTQFLVKKTTGSADQPVYNIYRNYRINTLSPQSLELVSLSDYEMALRIVYEDNSAIVTLIKE